MTEKRSKITDEHRAEAAALLAIWQAKHTLTQEEFGQTYGLGGQANVGHYLRARNPLNLKAATAFAQHLQCEIADFSARLYNELRSLSRVEGGASPGADRTSTGYVSSDTTLVRAPVVEWARLGEDVLKDPEELGGAEVLDYVQIGTPGKRAKLIPVVDDSLAPRLIIGDMVAIDPDNKRPTRGQVTLFRSTVDGQFFLRRYQPLANPDFEAVDAKGGALDSKRHGLEVVGVRCGMRPVDL